VATAEVTLVEWPGMILREQLVTRSLAIDGPMASGTPAGKLHIVMGDQLVDVPVVTAAWLNPPGMAWRVLRINLARLNLS
jgi:hypothetical protein